MHYKKQQTMNEHLYHKIHNSFIVCYFVFKPFLFMIWRKGAASSYKKA